MSGLRVQSVVQLNLLVLQLPHFLFFFMKLGPEFFVFFDHLIVGLVGLNLVRVDEFLLQAYSQIS